MGSRLSREENFADADRDGVDRMFNAHGQLKTGMWKTINGSEIRIVDMGNRHLINAIRMLERNAEKGAQALIDSGERFLTTLSGDMAQYSVEQGLHSLQSGEFEIEEIFPVYEELTEEADRRGLNWITP